MEKSLSPKHGIEAIKELNATKQYTLMATGLLELLVTDPNLTASAAKLWEYLYTKAIINEKLSVKIRYKDLADKFYRSERTMKRQVGNLKENGYLDVESNFHAHGQRANTFYLKIPQTIFEKLKNTKDRKRNPLPRIKASDSGLLQDKNVTLDHDTNVMPKDNINKEIINNNVVPHLEDMSEKAKDRILGDGSTSLKDEVVLRETSDHAQDILDQQQITLMESKVNLLYLEMGKITGIGKISIFDKIRALQAKISSITVIMDQRKHLEHIKTNEINTSSSFLDQTIDFSKLPGERSLSVTELTRINKSVEKLLLPAEDKKRICNEIIYSIRFGALRMTQNGATLSISHAISIALKLLREKRWETPALMQRKEKSGYHFTKLTHQSFDKEKPSYHCQQIGSILGKLDRQGHAYT